MDVDRTCQPTLASPSEAPPLLATWSRERQGKYTMPEIAPNDPTNTKKGKAPGVLPGSAMDDFINLPSFVPCRRLVPQLYFANNKRSKSFFVLRWRFYSWNVVVDGHHRCNPASPAGCQRCAWQPSSTCCDKCHSQAFEKFRVLSVKKKPSPRRSIIPTMNTRSSQHSLVEDVIYKWRYTQAVKHFGAGVVRCLGPQLLMSQDVLDRILVCWTRGKITDLSHFYRETLWSTEWVKFYGQSLIDILFAHPPFDIKPTVNQEPLHPPGSLLVPTRGLIHHTPASAVPTLVSQNPDIHPPGSLLVPTRGLVLPTLGPAISTLVPQILGLTLPTMSHASQSIGDVPLTLTEVIDPPRRPANRCSNCHQTGHNSKLSAR